MYSVDWKSHIFLMKNKLISDLTSQTKAGRGMAGAPGAAVTQRGPHQPHREVQHPHREVQQSHREVQEPHREVWRGTAQRGHSNHYGIRPAGQTLCGKPYNMV